MSVTNLKGHGRLTVKGTFAAVPASGNVFNVIAPSVTTKGVWEAPPVVASDAIPSIEGSLMSRLVITATNGGGSVTFTINETKVGISVEDAVSFVKAERDENINAAATLTANDYGVHTLKVKTGTVISYDLAATGSAGASTDSADILMYAGTNNGVDPLYTILVQAPTANDKSNRNRAHDRAFCSSYAETCTCGSLSGSCITLANTVWSCGC